jgi:hypothetical protein
MANVRQHSVRFIKKWDVTDKKGFVISVPNVPETIFADGETALGSDIAVTSDAVLKTVTMKTFSKSETVPALSRVVSIEDKLATFVTKDAYLQSETVQNQNILNLLNQLDVKDLDVSDFLTAVGKLATKEQIVTLQSALDAEKQINIAQNNQISELTAALADRVYAELNYEGIVDVTPQGTLYHQFLIPSDANLHCLRIFNEGLKLQKSSYSFTQTNDVVAGFNGIRVVFVDNSVKVAAELDLEVSLKKK